MADVFVFGSNSQGIHGKGAALHAKRYFGAIQGKHVGRQGNSYAIPTKLTPYKSHPIDVIKNYVEDFLSYARENYSESFNVTEIGCGLAGYSPKDIAPLFKNAPDNVNLPQSFKKELGIE